MSWIENVVLRHDRERAKRDEARRLAQGQLSVPPAAIPPRWAFPERRKGSK